MHKAFFLLLFNVAKDDPELPILLPLRPAKLGDTDMHHCLPIEASIFTVHTKKKNHQTREKTQS